MEDRQRQIQVGAGLQESRLNTDLIQFLNKYGSWILTVVLVVVLAYVGYTKYQQHLDSKRDEAFDAYLAARVGVGPDGVLTGSPDNLLRVADEKRGQGAVWELASLDAADICLGAARRGYRPGTDMANPKPEDALTDAEKTEQLKKADAAYRAVLDAAQRTGDKRPTALRARWGLVATALSLGEFDRAKAMLEEIVSAGERDGLEFQAALAKKRLEAMPRLMSPPVLLAEADLPESARAPKPSIQQVPAGQPIQIEGMQQPIMLPGDQPQPVPIQIIPPAQESPAPESPAATPAPAEPSSETPAPPTSPGAAEPARPQD